MNDAPQQPEKQKAPMTLKELLDYKKHIHALKADMKDPKKLAQNTLAQILAGLALILLVGVVYPMIRGEASPQQITQVKAPVQLYEIHDAASFKEKAKPYILTPFEDEELQFEIFLPEGWETEVATAAQRQKGGAAILSEVAHIRSPYIGIDRAEVYIQTLKLEHEISAQYWLKNHILSNSYVLEAPVDVKDGHRASAYYTQIINNKAISTYITVQINGNTANIAHFEIPLYHKEYLGFLQKASIDSFRNTFYNDKGIENLKIFTLIDAIKLSYPSSWKNSAPDFKDVNRPSIQIVNQNDAGQTEGYMRIVAVRRGPGKSFLEEVQALKKDFEDTLGVNFTKLLSTSNPKLGDRFIFSQVETYDIATPKNPLAKQEVRLAALGDAQWYIFIYLLTPSESSNLYAWARNNRTFDVMLESVK